MANPLDFFVKNTKHFMELVKRHGDLELENVRLKQQLAKCESEKATLESKLKEQIENPLYYTGTIYRDKKGVPYCPVCYDSRKDRIHLTPHLLLDWSFTCSFCGAKFEDLSSGTKKTTQRKKAKK